MFAELLNSAKVAVLKALKSSLSLYLAASAAAEVPYTFRYGNLQNQQKSSGIHAYLKPAKLLPLPFAVLLRIVLPFHSVLSAIRSISA